MNALDRLESGSRAAVRSAKCCVGLHEGKILTRDEILNEIKAGNVKIEPFEEFQVGPASVDLRLGNEFRVFRKVHDLVQVDDEADSTQITELVTVGDRFVLMPGETVLGITVERLSLPPYLCGWLEGRSRFARMGLMVHITASFMQPGIRNRQVLEISNVSPVPLALKPGTLICQFIFARCEGRAVYEGSYRDQMHP